MVKERSTHKDTLLPEEDAMTDPEMPKIRLPNKNDSSDTDTLHPSVNDALGQVRRATPSVWSNPGLLLGLIVAAILATIVVGLYSFAVSARLDGLATSAAAREARESSQDTSALLSGLQQRIAVLEQKQQELTASLIDTVSQSDFQAAIGGFNNELKTIQQRTVPAATKTPAQSSPAAPQTWAIHLTTLSESGAVDKFIGRAKTLGINVQMEQVSVNNKEVYRLSITGLASREEAEKVSTDVQQRLNLSAKPWIAKQQ